MSNKKVLTFRDYLNAIVKLKKVADDLEDIDKETGGYVVQEFCSR